MSVPAIILGGDKLGLAIIRALGEKGIPVICAYHNPMDIGCVSKYVKKSYRVTNPNIDEDLFLNDLMLISR